MCWICWVVDWTVTNSFRLCTGTSQQDMMALWRWGFELSCVALWFWCDFANSNYCQRHDFIETQLSPPKRCGIQISPSTKQLMQWPQVRGFADDFPVSKLTWPRLATPRVGFQPAVGCKSWISGHFLCGRLRCRHNFECELCYTAVTQVPEPGFTAFLGQLARHSLGIGVHSAFVQSSRSRKLAVASSSRNSDISVELIIAGLHSSASRSLPLPRL